MEGLLMIEIEIVKIKVEEVKDLPPAVKNKILEEFCSVNCKCRFNIKCDQCPIELSKKEPAVTDTLEMHMKPTGRIIRNKRVIQKGDRVMSDGSIMHKYRR
jgi:hypothetical protein